MMGKFMCFTFLKSCSLFFLLVLKILIIIFSKRFLLCICYAFNFFVSCVCVCILLFISWLIHLFPHLPFGYVHFHLPFCFNILSFFLGNWGVVHI
jgi:hypothetical protein